MFVRGAVCSDKSKEPPYLNTSTGFQFRNFGGMVVGAHKGKLKTIDSTTNNIPPTDTDIES